MKRILSFLAVFSLVCCGTSETTSDGPNTITTIQTVEDQASQTKTPQAPAEASKPAASAPASAPASATVNNKIIPVEALGTVEVPPLCGNQGGRLVGGELPVEKRGAPGKSTAQLARNSDGTPMGAYTDINGDGRDEAVLVYSCDKGGVSWPQNLLFYDNDLNLIGSSSDWDADGVTAQRSNVSKISWDDSHVYVDAMGWALSDSAAGPSRQVRYEVTMQGNQPVVKMISNQPRTS